jgi:ParB family chromosome partitioning protein
LRSVYPGDFIGIRKGGVLTADPTLLHTAARDMLKFVLSCRADMTDSGVSSRIAGETLGAATHLPTMATEEFLSCLSRQALERSAGDEGVKVEVRVKDTRASMVKHCTGKTWHFPGALFPLTDVERANAASARSHWVGGAGGRAQANDAVEGLGEPDAGDGEDDQSGSDDLPEDSRGFTVAAE